MFLRGNGVVLSQEGDGIRGHFISETTAPVLALQNRGGGLYL